MGISAMYNFRADPDLGLGKMAVRRIPCVCDGCPDQLNSVQKEETINKEEIRYKTNLKCKLNDIFEGLNKWRVTNLTTNKNDEVDDRRFYMGQKVGCQRRL